MEKYSFTVGEISILVGVIAQLAVTLFMVAKMWRDLYGNGKMGLMKNFQTLYDYCSFKHRQKPFSPTPDPDKDLV